MIEIINTSFKVAFSSLSVNKARSFLTILGIVIGVSAVIVLVSIGSGLQEFVSNQFQGLGTNLLVVLPGKIDVKTGRGRVPGTGLPASKFTLSDVRDLSKDSPFIKEAVPILNTNTTVKVGSKEVRTTATGTSASYSSVRNISLASGYFFNSSQEKSGRKVAVLGSTVVKNLFGEGAVVPIGSQILISGDHFTIIGSLLSRGASFGGADVDDQVFIPITAAQKKFGVDNPSLLYIEAVSIEDISAAHRDAVRILSRHLKEDNFTVLDQRDLLSTVNTILSSLTVALGGIAAISLLVGGIGIMNIMLVTVTERTREIGLRKALGARRCDILLQFLVESIILSSAGGILGIILGFLGSFLLSKILTTEVPIWSVLVSFSSSALVGIIFGILPAYKAAKLDPIEALRYE